ncbi:hypothetical protein SDJN03_17263, partial [Cucurbita argyrosperma subsp. sororia]
MDTDTSPSVDQELSSGGFQFLLVQFNFHYDTQSAVVDFGPASSISSVFVASPFRQFDEQWDRRVYAGPP